MTINNTAITAGPYAGNDLVDTYSIGWLINDKTEVKVYETDDTGAVTLLTVDTDYTVTGFGTEGSGEVTRVAGALPTGYTWYLRSAISSVQETDFNSQGGFYPGIHEAALDKLTLLVQQNEDRIDRSIRVADSDYSGADLTWPTPTPLRVVGWNAAGDALENKDVDLASASGYADAAGVSAAAAAAAQTGAQTAQGLAETAQGLAETAQGLAETAQAAAEAAAAAYLEGNAVLYSTGTTSVPDTTNTIIVFNSALYAYTGTWTVGDPTKLVIPAGFNRARLKATLTWDAGTKAGYRSITLLKNGNATNVGIRVYDTVDGTVLDNPVNHISSPPLQVTAGDYFELQAYQNSGGAIASQPLSTYTWFSLELFNA